MTEVLTTLATGCRPSIPSGPIVNDSLQCAGQPVRCFQQPQGRLDLLGRRGARHARKQTGFAPYSGLCQATPRAKCAEFRQVTAVVTSDPVEIQTSVPLVGPGSVALMANDEVIVSGVVGVSGVNGRWKVSPLDSSGMRFRSRAFMVSGARPRLP